jgi:hypothetical protein
VTAATEGAAPSLYQLADAVVHLPVRPTDRGPEPLFGTVGEVLSAVAFSAREAAVASAPEGYGVIAMRIADIVRNLPEGTGLVVDANTEDSFWVSPEEREQVVEAGLPFPVGAPVQVGEPAEEPAELVQRLRELAPTEPGLHRMWRAWYSVADTPARLLVVYACDPGEEMAAGDLITRAAQEVRYPHRMIPVSESNVPTQVMAWLRESLSPFWDDAAPA